MNRLIQVAQIYDRDTNPMNGRVYSPKGICPCLRTPTGGVSEPLIMIINEKDNQSAGGVRASYKP